MLNLIINYFYFYLICFKLFFIENLFHDFSTKVPGFKFKTFAQINVIFFCFYLQLIFFIFIIIIYDWFFFNQFFQWDWDHMFRKLHMLI